MQSQRRLKSCLPLVFFVFGSILLVHAATAATLCTGLPPSTLQVLDIKASAVDEVWVSAEDLDYRVQAEGLISHHKQMMSASDIVAWFDIEHRIVPRDDGTFCDAPTLVRMGFGSSRRRAFLSNGVVGNPCVRQRLLDHEADHNGAFNEIVDRFIDQHRDAFQQGMISLKQTSAPSEDIARVRWEAGMRLLLIEAKQQLRAEIRDEIARIDALSPLTELENDCGEKPR